MSSERETGNLAKCTNRDRRSHDEGSTVSIILKRWHGCSQQRHLPLDVHRPHLIPFFLCVAVQVAEGAKLRVTLGMAIVSIVEMQAADWLRSCGRCSLNQIDNTYRIANKHIESTQLLRSLFDEAFAILDNTRIALKTHDLNILDRRNILQSTL